MDDATAIAVRYNHRVEVTSLDEPATTIYANPDGSSTSEESADDVRMMVNGAWVPVDTTLVRASSGQIRPAAVPSDIEIGGGGSLVAYYRPQQGGEVAYGWPGTLPAPSISGPTATFSDVYPGVDLVATASATGVETSLVYRSAQALAAHPSVKLNLEVTGLNASVASNGSIAYSNSGGTVVADTPVPLGWDARGGGSVTGPGTGPVGASARSVRDTSGKEMTGSGQSESGTLNQTVAVPTELANDPDVTYPVVVDPSVLCRNCTENAHGYVENDGYDEINSHFDGGTVHVGSFNNGTTKTRGLYSFKQGSSHGTRVTKAVLELGNVYAWSCSATSMAVYESSPFDSATSWNTATLATTDNAVSKSFAYGYSSSCGGREVDFDVTGIANHSANSSQTNYSFQLRAGSETTNTYWKKFQSKAVLALTYDTPPNAPTSTALHSAVPTAASGTCKRGSTRPVVDPTLTSTWQAKLSDADKGNQLRVQFQWWDLATPSATHATGLLGHVASGKLAFAAFAGSTTTFLDGHNYGFRARANDGTLYSDWSSADGVSTCEFTATVTPPLDPYSLAFASPSVACQYSATTAHTSLPVSVRGNLPMRFRAVVADSESRWGKTVRAVFSVSVGNTEVWSWTSPYGPDRGVVTAAMPANTVPDGSRFAWTVRAYNGVKYSAKTPVCTGTADNSVPPEPTITSGGVFGQPGSPAGHVGEDDSISLASTGAVAFVWSQSDGPATSMPARGSCGSVSKGVHTVCASQGSGWNQFTLHARQPESVVSAVAYNAAGTSSAVGSATFDVNEFEPNHAWLTDGVVLADNPTSVEDAYGGPPMAVTSGGTGWVSTEYPGEDIDTAGPIGGPTRYGTALALNGAGYAATTAGATTMSIDMSHSFSAQVWVRPSHASSGHPEWAMSQDGATNSAFLLGQYAGYWALCMPHTQSASTTYDGDCAYIAQPTTTSQYVGKWTLLTAVWDARANQMQLYANGVQSGQLANASHESTGAASGPVAVGEGQNAGTRYPSWTGDVLNPVTYPGVLGANQLAQYYQCGLPQDFNAVCS